MLFVFSTSYPCCLLNTFTAMFNLTTNKRSLSIASSSSLSTTTSLLNVVNNDYLPHDRVNNLLNPIGKNAIHLTEYHRSVNRRLCMPRQDHWCAVSETSVIIGDDVIIIIGAWMSSCGIGVFVENV